MVASSRLQAFSEDDEAWHARRAAKKARLHKCAVAAQRKRVAAAVALLLNGGQGPQGKKRVESPFSWADHLARLTEREFKQRYRLDYDSFKELVNVVRPDASKFTDCECFFCAFPGI